MTYFGVSADTIQWLTTGFMIVMYYDANRPWLLNNMSFKRLFALVLILFDLGLNYLSGK